MTNPNPNYAATLAPRWQPGQSANAHGVQKGFRRVLVAARKHSLEAFETVLAVMRDPMTPPATKLACAVTILDRAWGKPKEHLQLDGEGLTTLQIRFVDERSDGPIVDAEAFQLTIHGAAAEEVSAQPDAQPIDNARLPSARAEPIHEPLHKQPAPARAKSEDKPAHKHVGAAAFRSDEP